jgi:hypothetical protein
VRPNSASSLNTSRNLICTSLGRGATMYVIGRLQGRTSVAVVVVINLDKLIPCSYRMCQCALPDSVQSTISTERTARCKATIHCCWQHMGVKAWHCAERQQLHALPAVLPRPGDALWHSCFLSHLTHQDTAQLPAERAVLPALSPLGVLECCAEVCAEVYPLPKHCACCLKACAASS